MGFGSDTPAVYRLRIAERLDRRWSEWFDGLSIVSDEQSTTLCGEVADQTALHAMLHKLRDLGVVLLSVERVQGC
jgi:hypothetical protein